jgi:hypothetical protein
MSATLARSIVISGLPESGKTTFLAALWHLVTSRERTDTKLKFGSLKTGQYNHLNGIMERWQQALEQIHTHSSSGKVVSMNLKDSLGAELNLTFPDLSGESYQHMWEARECDNGLADILRTGDGILLFVNADKIVRPKWVTEVIGQEMALGPLGSAGRPAKWHPKFAPTQVQLVELLQLLRSPQLGVSANKLGIMLSAWDKVEIEGRDPVSYLAESMPLLDQYLRNGIGRWDYRIYGVSAQGGEYAQDGKYISPQRQAKIDAVRAVPEASSRIKLYTPALTHDLTEPLAWLME